MGASLNLKQAVLWKAKGFKKNSLKKSEADSKTLDSEGGLEKVVSDRVTSALLKSS